jgi:prepilin-type processing-associated H-X9-DG protein
MNARISGVSIDDMDAPTQVVLLYEALVPGKNTADAGESVVPGGRHEGAVGVAFCDGHVQMVSIEQFRRLRFDPRPPR